jgi:hypothetical protein
VKTRGVALLAVVVLSLVGCATNSRAVRSEFDDIPVLKGLTYVESRSTIIESPSIKAARLLYRGRIEITSLALATRATLEANGWRSVSSNSVAAQGITQVYEKADTSLQVRLWEGWYFTYVEITTGRALQAAK